ncbi:MAG: YgfZ/GcvT domain-containing protein [Actinomycetota bacterium]
MDTNVLEEQVRALDEGRAFVDGSRLRMVEAVGGDAAAWLNDLVTAAVEDLAEKEAVRSLLLTPTGRVRADFHVARASERFLLLQDPDQPMAVYDLLEQYVLSSDVALRDPGGDIGPILVPTPSGWSVAWAPPAGAAPADPQAAEVWRIRRGIPRFPIDFNEDSLPAEAGLEHLIDFAKGCFLGQESVAKVRNMGHPRRAVVALRATEPVHVGERVLAGGQDVGEVTSAAPFGIGTALIASVRWEARSGGLHSASGPALAPA